jgi:hypothetical protein
MWIPFMRSNGLPRTPWEAAARIGEVTEIEFPIFGRAPWLLVDVRMTSDPRRVEFRVEPA